MKYSASAREVRAPNGEWFIVAWAMPRHIERTFGSGRWGVEVMRMHGRLPGDSVQLSQVADATAGKLEMDRLVADIESGRWEPPEVVAAGRSVRELPRWTMIPIAFLVMFLARLAFGHPFLSSVVGAAVFVALLMPFVALVVLVTRRSKGSPRRSS